MSLQIHNKQFWTLALTFWHEKGYAWSIPPLFFVAKRGYNFVGMKFWEVVALYGVVHWKPHPFGT